MRKPGFPILGHFAPLYNLCLYAVVVKKLDSIVGHVPHTISTLYHFFVQRWINMMHEVTGVISLHFQKDINNIEMVQCRAARFVFNSYTYNTSVSTLLDALNWPTLQQRRNNLKAIMMYKIINNLIRIPANQFLTPVSSSTRNHHHHYKIPYSRINAHLFSFFPMSMGEVLIQVYLK